MAKKDDYSQLLEKLRKEIKDIEKGLISVSANELASKKLIIESLEAAILKQREFNKENEKTVDQLSEISKAIFNIDYSQVISQVKNLNELTAIFEARITEATYELTSVMPKINDSFQELIQSQNDLALTVNNLRSVSPEMAAELERAATNTQDLTVYIQRFGEQGVIALMNAASTAGTLGDALNASLATSNVVEFQNEIRRLETQMIGLQDKVINLDLLFGKIGENFLRYFGFAKIIPALQDFDNKLAKIKKEFQLPVDSFYEASVAMADLTVQGSKFGISQEKNFALVKQLSEEARSVSIASLASVAQQLQAIPAATGIALEQVGAIAGKMMFLGASANKIENIFKNISKYSAIYGLNVTKVSTKIAEALPRWQRMGFKGGEESLIRMAAKAEKMGLDLGKLLDLSDKFLDINTSLEAAADLSLLGGAAGQTNFLDIMKAAQEGGNALIDLTGRMTSDIGRLNASGALQLNMVDRQRIKAIAAATGEDVESISNQINDRLQSRAKQASIPSGIFSSLKQDEKDFLLSKVVKDKGGKFKLEGFDGITDLKNVSQSQIQAMIKQTKEDAANLEKSAENRRSLEESFKAFTDSMLTIMNVFQPLLQGLTWVMNGFNKGLEILGDGLTRVFGDSTSRWIKAAAALSAVLLITLGPTAIAKFAGALSNPIKGLGGLFGKIRGAFTAGRTGIPAPTTIPGTTPPLTGGAIPSTSQTFLQQLKDVSPKQLLALSAAIVALGASFMLIGAGIKFAADGMANLAGSFKGLENAGAALGAVSVVMGGFVGMLALMIPIIPLLGAGAGVAAIPLLALGGAFLMMGGGVFLAATGLATLVKSVGSLGKNVNTLFTASAGIGALALSLTAIAPSLILFGAAGLVAIPALLGLGAGMALASVGFKLLTPELVKLSNIKSDGLSNLGKNLIPFAKSLLSFVPIGLLSPLIALGVGAGIIAATGIDKISKSLSSIKFVDTKLMFSFIKDLPSLVMPLLKFSAVGLLSPLLLAAGFSLNKLLSTLSKTQSFNSKNLSELAGILPELGKSLSLFSLSGVTAPLSLLASGSLIAISKGLSYVSNLNYKNLSGLGGVLKSIAPGMLAFSAAGILSVGAIMGASALMLISKSFSQLSNLNYKNLLSLGDALLNIVPGFVAFSAVGILGIGAIAGAAALSVVSKSLALMSGIDITKLSGLGTVLKNIAPGLLAFSLAGLVSGGATIGANSLTAIANALKTSSGIDVTKFNNLGSVLSKIAPGLVKFSIAGMLSSGAVQAGQALTSIAKAFTSLKDIELNKFITLGSVLASLSPGLLKFSLAGLLSSGAITAGSALNAIAKSFKIISEVELSKINGFGDTLSKIAPGLVKFSAAGLVASGAISGGNALTAIATGLKNLNNIEFSKFTSLGSVLSNISSGLIKFGIAGLVSSGIDSAAKALVVLGKSLNLIGEVDASKTSKLGEVLSSIAPGLVKFSIAGLLSNGAKSGGEALSSISKSFQTIGNLDVNKISSLGKVLSDISFGLIKFSIAGAISQGAILGSSALNAIGKAFTIFDSIKFNNLNSLGTTLSNIAPGLFKFSLAGSVSDGAISGGLALTAIAKAFQVFSNIKTESLNALGSVLSNITPGLVKFSLAGLVSSGAISAGQALNELSKSFKMFAGIKLESLLGLGKVLAEIAPGLMKFSLAGILSEGAASSSKVLSEIAKTFEAFSNISFAKLNGIGNVLSDIAPGLIKFSLAGLLSNGAKSGADALNILAGSFKIFENIKTESLNSLGSILSNVAPGLMKFSIAGLLAEGAIKAGSALNVIGKAFQLFSETKTTTLNSLGQTLSSIAPGLIKFSIAGLASNGAYSASQALISIAKSFELIKSIDTKNITPFNEALQTIVPGLMKFSVAGILSGGATQMSLALSSVANAFQQIKGIDFNTISNLGSALGNITPGLVKFSLGGLVSQGVKAMSAALNDVVIAFENLKGIEFNSLLNLGNVLGNITPGLMKFSISGILSSGAKAMGSALNDVGNAFKQLNGINFNALLNLGNVLGNITPGLMKFSISGILSSGAKAMGSALNDVGNAFQKLKGIEFNSLLELGNVLGNIAPGLMKFSVAGLISQGAKAMSSALNSVATAFQQLNGINFESLANLGNILGNITPGLMKFSIAGLLSKGAKAMGSALNDVAIAFQQLKGIDFNSLTSIGTTMGNITPGLMKFSIAGILSSGAKAMGSALKEVANAFSQLKGIEFNSLLKFGSVLENITPGLIKFSLAGLISQGAILGSTALNSIGKAFQSFIGVNSDNLNQVGTILSNISPGLVKFSLAGLLSNGAVAGSNALTNIGKALSSLSNIKSSFINELGNTLSNIAPGLVKFSVAGFLSSGAILGGKAINLLAQSFEKISSIDINKANEIGSILSNIAPGLAKFSLAGLISNGAILGGSALTSIANALKTITNIDSNSVKEFGNSLNSIFIPLTKFSLIGIVASSITSASQSVSTLFKSLGSLKNIDTNSFNGLGEFLSNITMPLIKFSSVGLFGGLLMDSGEGLTALFKGLNTLSAVNFSSFTGVENILSGLISSITSFSVIGLLVPLLDLIGPAISSLSVGLNSMSGIDFGSLLNAGSVLGSLVDPLTSLSFIGIVSPALLILSKSITGLGSGLTEFSKGARNLTGIDLSKLTGLSSIIDSLTTPILNFSSIGLFTPLIALAAGSISLLGKGLQFASSGFNSFANIAWDTMTGIPVILNSLLNSFGGFNKGFSLSPNVLSLSNTFSSISYSLNNVSTSFEKSTKSMADFNIQLEKLKVNSKGIESANFAELKKINEVTAGSNNNNATTSKPANNAPVEHKFTFAPFRVQLEYPDGKVLHQVITDANYNRS